MNWRERIAVARARGGFDEADYQCWLDAPTCLVGEAENSVFGGHKRARWDRINELLNVFCASSVSTYSTFQYKVLDALKMDDFSAVETWLEQAEDVAMRVKRESTA